MESQKSPSIRGLIIASGVEKDIFTAGNDLRQLYAPLTSKQAYRKFWLTQTQFLTRLYRSPLVTIAAIRGHAPAGNFPNNQIFVHAGYSLLDFLYSIRKYQTSIYLNWYPIMVYRWLWHSALL